MPLDKRSSKQKQLLFVVEGEHAEGELILAAMRAIGVDTERFAVLTFQTNIHALIECIVGDTEWQPDAFSEVEIREVLADLLETGRGSLQVAWGADANDTGDLGPDWLRRTRFTDAFLMFDFDPHDDRYDSMKLMSFQRAYYDSTNDVGKLLLSYPMLESYREACALELEEYLELEAHEPLSTYKNSVHAQLQGRGLGKYCDLSTFDRMVFAKGAAHAAAKAHALLLADARASQDVMRDLDLAARCDGTDLCGLLAFQQHTFDGEASLPSISTLLFFLSVWPEKLNRSWRRCKSMGIV